MYEGEIRIIEFEYLILFSEMYGNAENIFGEPLNASKKQQCKIRKWINNHYIDEIAKLPEDLLRFFHIKTSDAEQFSFLKKCREEAKRKKETRTRKIEAELSLYDESVKAAFWRMMDYEFWHYTKQGENNIQIVVDDNPTFQRVLTLKGVSDIPNEDYLDPFALKFCDAEVSVQVFDACENIASTGGNLWDNIIVLSFYLVQKAELPGYYCNDAELKLLPLMREIIALEYDLEWMEQGQISFVNLKNLTERYHLKKACKLLQKLETIGSSDIKFDSIAEKLNNIFREKKYELMWNEVFEEMW